MVVYTKLLDPLLMVYKYEDIHIMAELGLCY